MHASLGAIGRLGTVDDDEPPIEEADDIQNDSPDDIKVEKSFKADFTVRFQKSSRLYFNSQVRDKLNEIFSYYIVDSSLSLLTIRRHLDKSIEGTETSSEPFKDLSDTTALLRILTDSLKAHCCNEYLELSRDLFDLTAYFYRIVSQEFYPHRFPMITFGISPLDNIRSICEIIREYMCQSYDVYDRLTKTPFYNPLSADSLKCISDKVFNNSIYYSTSLALIGHYLIIIGMSRLGNLDVNRCTHQELWDMSRGIEEINIITESLKKLRQQSNSSKDIFHRRKEIFDLSQSFLLEDVIFQLANIRSNRLVQILKEQIIQSPAFISYIHNGPVEGYDSFDHHHNYLLKSSHFMSADYLRNEYEFSSAILDIFAQSTELIRDLKRNIAYQNKNITDPSDLKKLKEKNRGLLHSKDNVLYDVKEYANPSWSTKLFHSHSLEETIDMSSSSCIDDNRHAIRRRMSTFNSPKKVRTEGALGFVFSDRQLTSVDFDYDLSLEEFNRGIRKQTLSRVCEMSEVDEKTKETVKKSVHWSDFEEVPLRHQAVGRYLDFVWWNINIKLFNEWFNSCPSRTSNKGNGNDSSFIQSLGKTSHNEASSPTKQPLLPNSILLFDNTQLKRFSQFLKIISRSEIFPLGLLPILKHQSAQISFLSDQADFIKYSFPKFKLTQTMNSAPIAINTIIIDDVYPEVNEDRLRLCRLFQIKDQGDEFVRNHFIYLLKILRQVATIFECNPNELIEIDAMLRKIDYKILKNKSDLFYMATLTHFISSIKWNLHQISAYLKTFIPCLCLNICNLEIFDTRDLLATLITRYESIVHWAYLMRIMKRIIEKLILAWNLVSGWMEKATLAQMISHSQHDDKKTGMSTKLASCLVAIELKAILTHLSSTHKFIIDESESFLIHYQIKCRQIIKNEVQSRINPGPLDDLHLSRVILKYFGEINETLFTYFKMQKSPGNLVSNSPHICEMTFITFEVLFSSWMSHLSPYVNTLTSDARRNVIPMDQVENILIAYEVDELVKVRLYNSAPFKHLSSLYNEKGPS